MASPTPIAPLIERHYTINELSEALQISFERCRQMVKSEPGVLRFGRQSPGKRSRTLYRIPESVIQRILRRCANPPRGLIRETYTPRKHEPNHGDEQTGRYRVRSNTLRRVHGPEPHANGKARHRKVDPLRR